MFKQIRNKILLLNMAMVSSVVIIAFIVVLATTYTRTQSDNRAKLLRGGMEQLIVSGGGAFRSRIQHAQPAQDGSVISSFATRISPDTGLSFSLLVDAASNVLEINSMMDLQTETYNQAAQTAMAAHNTGSITLEGRRWQFSASPITLLIKDANDPAVAVRAIPGEFSYIRFLDVTDSYRMLQSLALILLGLSVAVLAIFFFISRFFANRAVRPMEEAWEKQNRFAADASHELKTPLTVINANCSVLYANRDETVEKQIKWVDNIARAADRMTGLVGSLLSLADMENAMTTPGCRPFDLSAEVAEATSEMDAAALGKNIAIRRSIEPGVEIENDRERVRKVLSILLDNAVKYANENGEVSVSLKREKRRAICSVRNNGVGIPQEELPHLFDRFYRGDPARSSKNSGYGLGLAIAQAITKQLGTNISVDSVPGEYTEFRIVFEKTSPHG
ncbi:MAG: HAMP domain-containing histidine kinase [Clostridiales bacterium]|jgi:signal transduction histidine kinase|nr:HAMP domain-containing histidine kinase [Clostridiales bacterium]